jgi:hypothetical protein
LGRVADVGGYAASYVVAGGIMALAVPFAVLARRENASSDPIVDRPGVPSPEEVATAPAPEVVGDPPPDVR